MLSHLAAALLRLAALATRWAARLDPPPPEPVLEPALSGPSATAIALAAMQAQADSIVLACHLRAALHRHAPRAEIAQA